MALKDLFSSLNKNTEAQTSALQSFGDRFKTGGQSTVSNPTFTPTLTPKPSNNMSTQSNMTFSGSTVAPQKPTNITSSQEIPVSSVGTQSFQYPPETPSTIKQYGGGVEPMLTPAPVAEKANTRKQIEDAILKNLSTDTSSDRERIRQEQGVAEKQARANALAQKYDATNLRYQKQLETLEKNPEGLFGGALIDRVNDLSREASRELADISLAQRIANDDYQGAEKIVQERLSDLRADEDRKLNLMSTAISFFNNDMSESEKLAAQQNFELMKLQSDDLITSEKGRMEQVQLQEQASGYIKQIENGTLGLKDVPDKIQPYVASLMSSNSGVTAAQKAKSALAINMANNMFDLLSEKYGGLGFEVGAGIQRNVLKPIGSFLGLGGKSAQRETIIKNIVAQFKLENVEKLRGLGAMSDKEFSTLAEASTVLSTTTDEATFTSKLKEYHDILTSSTVDAPGVPLQDKAEILKQNLMINNPGISDEQLTELMRIRLAPSTADEVSVSIPPSSRLAFVNNNPGNLRFAGQTGATPGEGGFARFATPQEGYRALLNQITLDQSRGQTVAQFVSKYAPPTENDTQSYISFVTNQLGVSKNTPLSALPIDELAKVVAQKESSTLIS